MTVTNAMQKNALESTMAAQETFQSTGNETGKAEEKKTAAKKVSKENAGIPKVKAEIMDEAALKEAQEKLEAKRLQQIQLASKSLDSLTENIRREVDGISKSFCKIGYFLWKIREDKLYLARDFKNVYDFGEAVLGFRRSSTGNYISVCERFSRRDSKGNPSRELMDDYKSFSYTQLTEVLSLPEGKEKEVNPSMTVKEIRKLKAEAKKAEKGVIEPDSVASVPFEYSRDCRPPICIWDRVVDHKNLDTLIKAIKSQGFGKTFSVYVEQEEPQEESAN